MTRCQKSDRMLIYYSIQFCTFTPFFPVSILFKSCKLTANYVEPYYANPQNQFSPYQQSYVTHCFQFSNTSLEIRTTSM